jgi:serine/threonine-protein kinase
MATCPTCYAACDDGAQACPVDGTPLTDPLLGRIVGDRYRILCRIGSGGMGTVYRAEHVLLRKRVAVKVLRAELSSDEELVRRFQQEAIAASAIGQENIVDVTDFGRTAQGALYFVMEELPGVSLAALLRARGPLPVERAAPILAQVCRALGAAHARGIVHRDLKPDNVLVMRRDDGTDFVKVVDFGISKTGSGREPARLTRAGTIIGTPEYMAPEQGAAATVDHRADVYAFGVLAYELVTGTLPFQGETAIATLLEHQTKAPEPPRRRRPGLDPELEKLILRALAKRPEARPQTMADVASALTRVLVGLGLPPVYEHAPDPPPARAPYAGFTERFAPPPSPSPGRGATIEIDAPPVEPLEPTRRLDRGDRRRERRGGRAVASAAVALAVAVTGGALWAWLRAGAAAATPGAPTAGAGTAAPGAPGAAAPAIATAELPPPAMAPSASPGADATPAAATPAPAPQPSAPAVPAASPTSADVAAHAPPPRRRSKARALGPAQGSGDNPYVKLDDLKPDPF